MYNLRHFHKSYSSCVIDVTHTPNTLINNQNFIHMTKHLRYLFAVLLVWVCTVGGYAQTIVFQESFSKCSSTGGNDKNWATTIGGNELTSSSKLDNSGWTSMSKVYEANQCVKLAAAKAAGKMTTPSIKYEAGCSYTLSFKAGGLTGKTPTLTLSISNGTLSKTSFSLSAGAFVDYSADITATGDFTITFNVPQKQQSLLDEIVITKISSSSATATTTTFNTSDGLNVDDQTFNLVNGKYNGEAFVGYKATCTTDGAVGTIEYTSSEESVATVGTDGALTIVGTGTTEITAMFVPDDATAYATSFAKYTVVNAEPAKTATFLSFGADKDGSTVALTEGLLADGSDFTGYTATESTGAAGAISYAASGDNVAIVDATTGALTINKTTYGTTTITATFTPTDTETYATSTATYTVTNEKNVDESTIVFSSNDKSFADISNLSGSGYQSGSVVFVASNGKSYTFNCKRVLLSNDRLQINNSTVTSPKFDNFTDGYNLTVTYASSKGNLKLSSGSSNVTGTSTGGTSTYKSVTLNVSDGSSFVIKETKSNVLYIKSIEIVKNAPKTDPALSFANATQEVELKKGSVEVQTVTTPSGFDGTVTYVSSDNTIAEVTEGMIELKKTGEVTIKATSAATDNYAAGSAEYTLKVVDNRAEAPVSVKEESVSAELYVGLYDPADNVNNTNNLKLTYASSNADIALNEVGYLAFSKTGSSTITVSFAGDKTYKPFTGTFTLNVVDARADAPISFKEQTVTVNLLTEEYEASKNVTNEQNLTLAYAIDNEEYQIDDKTGYVVFNKVGSATVTVSFAGNETYKPFTGTFTLNVKDPRTEDAAFKFDAESYDIDLADETYADATFDANAKLQNPNGLTYAWTISPADNGESISESGKATGLKRGTYTITATSATNNNYLATTATCQLIVKNSAVEEKTVEFIAGTDKGEKSGADPDQMQKSFVSIVSGRAAFGRGDNYRFYQTYTDASGNTQTGETTISTKKGNIVKVEFVGSGNTTNKYGLDNLSTEDNRYSATDPNYGVWTGSAQSVTFTASATAYATNIIVTLEMPVLKQYTINETTTNVIENYENANVTLKRTLSASYWNTFCVPFALDAEEVTKYFGEGTQLRTYEGNCEGNIVNFATVTSIEAGKPYLMKPGNAVVTDPVFKNVSMVADDLDADGNPQAVGATTSVQMKGIYNHVTLKQSQTNLFLGDGDKFYYPADAEACEMDGLRAYFIVPEGTDIKKLRANIDGTTSLNAVFGTEETDAAIYNLQGVYVGNSLKQLKSGIYIQNGKKIVVK